jgi:hypothetical protein
MGAPSEIDSLGAYERDCARNGNKAILDRADIKYEAQNPKFETISNDQISNVPNKKV